MRLVELNEKYLVGGANLSGHCEIRLERFLFRLIEGGENIGHELESYWLIKSYFNGMFDESPALGETYDEITDSDMTVSIAMGLRYMRML